jgi:hypothetical protein
MDGTTLIDCTATFEKEAPQKVLRCSTVKVAPAKGASTDRARFGLGMDGYAMVTIALVLKILDFHRSHKPGGARPLNDER